LIGIEKRFGPVHALRGADFVLAPGEVHALLGENGAGKTTLMHVAAGLLAPDAGAVEVDGRPVALRSPRDARRLGIGMVHQHSTAVPSLTVAENVALAAGWPARPRERAARFRELVERTGLALEADGYAGRLSVALKQRLEILKALAARATVLLLDEPTAVLAPPEVGDLFRLVRAHRDAGGAVVLITHKLDEALAVADRVTVLRRGAVTAHGPASTFSPGSLAAAMLGSTAVVGAAIGTGANAAGGTAGGAAADASIPASTDAPTPAPVVVRAEHLDLPRLTGWGVAIRGGALQVRAGEIVGVAAVEGSGELELLRAVAGLLTPLRGRLDVASPVGHVPGDRTTEGLIPEFTLAENLVLGLGESAPWVRRGRIRWRQARRRAAELVERFGIRAPGPDARAAALSGGNQQKLVVARALERGPRVLVAEHPTRGLDVGAAAAVHERLRAAAAAGAAVLLHAGDLDELLALATRVVVVAGGAILDPPAGATRGEIGELMLRGRR
jgi:simple sugar transport system ATP-binding protein